MSDPSKSRECIPAPTVTTAVLKYKRLDLSALWKLADCKNCGQQFEQRRSQRKTICPDCRKGKS